MNTEQNEQQQVAGISSEVLSSDQVQQEKVISPEPEDTRQLIQDVARETGEDAASFTKHNVNEVLDKMKEGVTITIHISHPRFFRRLTTDDLGLTAGSDLATSEAANMIINEYFQLGRRALLPKDYQDRLANAESSARYNLAHYSFKSHWGAFVPRSLYGQWKKDNERLEAEFWSVRDDIVVHYDSIIETVVEASRPLAEDAWRRIALGTLLKTETTFNRELLDAVVARLHAEEGKTAFVEHYLACIRGAMPARDQVETGFVYRVERGVVPLPSLLAKDMESADRIYRERAIQDAQTQAELAAIETRRRVELQKLTLQQREEAEASYRKIQLEQERQREQLEMERDVLKDARRQKERLVQEFYADVVGQINTLVYSVSQNVLDSLDTHGGTMRGRVSTQLRNLVKQLDQLNFMNDQRIEEQLKRLRAVLPSEGESEKAAKGLGKIDTTRINQVVRSLNQEAEKVLIDLGMAPKPRTKREGTAEPSTLVSLAARRTARTTGPVVPGETTPRKRREREGL